MESLQKSLWAGLIGFLAVAIFMIVVYRLPGLLAVFALGLYAFITLSIFKMIPVTMTLAGIAGFILSVGMAVDANVLIFERTKEELKRGLSVTQALNEGFSRAWLSIRDSNASSLITCLILMWFGTSVIKGFAVTLSIGILVSMFSAITVTRILLHFFGPFIKNPWWFLGEKKQ
jgi:preprotein translocase subunit SecD